MSQAISVNEILAKKSRFKYLYGCPLWDYDKKFINIFYFGIAW